LLHDCLDQQHRLGTSARQFARAHDLPRSTLRHWRRRLDRDQGACAFFESPGGLDFLHRLVTALHLVFSLQGAAGIRLLSQFLRLAGLDRFVAASFGSRQQFHARLEQAVVDFAQKQRQALAKAMPARAITLAADETFHPACCLVALEAESGFLLVEQYSSRRDQAAWDETVGVALQGLPVTVACVASDEARGLLAHAQHGLAAEHSPDLFHVQQEVSRSVGPALSAQTRAARGLVEQAEQLLTRAQAEQQAAAGKPRKPGRPVDHGRRVAQAQDWLQGCQRYQERCAQRQERVREAVRGLGEDDHPFDLRTGQPVSQDEVRRRLEERLRAVEQETHQADIAGRTRPGLSKARRVLPGLAAAVAFFWLRLRAAAAARYGAAAWAWVVKLVASQYLSRVAGRTKGAARRQQIRALAEQLRAEARQGQGGAAPPDGWTQAESVCREWAGWFVRSSSAVEGRNGQLGLRQHAWHRLGARKLAALTAVHNYWLRRPDGTTAAERFFGHKPADLFEHLLATLPVPARPAKRRQAA
jgi:hypothetical protein